MSRCCHHGSSSARVEPCTEIFSRLAKAGLASSLLAYPALHYGHPITRNIGAWWGPRRFVPVAVGMRFAPHPPRGSGLEELPHPALASSGDGSAARRIRMTDSGRGEPAVDQSLHASPRYISELTAPS